MTTLKAKSIRFIALCAAVSLLAGCEIKFDPSRTWDKWFKPETDTEYYQDKSDDLVATITRESVQED